MYVSRMLREACAEAADSAEDAGFRERLLDALTDDRPVKAAIRALIPAAAKQPAPRASRR